jgi:hypothetical protein
MNLVENEKGLNDLQLAYWSLKSDLKLIVVSINDK